MTRRAGLQEKFVPALEVARSGQRGDEFLEGLLTDLLCGRQFAGGHQSVVVRHGRNKGILKSAG